MKSAWIAVGMLGLASGCIGSGRDLPGAEPGEGAAPGLPAPFTATCLHRVDCAAEEAQCRAAQDTRCDICFASCVSSGSCDLCFSACSTTNCACGGTDGACTDWSYEFQIPDSRDETHYAACRRFWDRKVECGIDADPAALCDRFARVERPEMATVYDCFAAGEVCVTSGACSPPQDDVFADEICDGTRCTSSLWTWLAKLGGWLREDVKDMARRCLSEDHRTGVPQQCVDAWLRMVGAQ